VVCFGANDKGQLGRGHSSFGQSSPMTLAGLHLPPGVKIVQVACGGAHTALLAGLGEVWLMGDGSKGQLGSLEVGAGAPRALPRALFGDQACVEV